MNLDPINQYKIIEGLRAENEALRTENEQLKKEVAEYAVMDTDNNGQIAE